MGQARTSSTATASMPAAGCHALHVACTQFYGNSPQHDAQVEAGPVGVCSTAVSAALVARQCSQLVQDRAAARLPLRVSRMPMLCLQAAAAACSGLLWLLPTATAAATLLLTGWRLAQR